MDIHFSDERPLLKTVCITSKHSFKPYHLLYSQLEALYHLSPQVIRLLIALQILSLLPCFPMAYLLECHLRRYMYSRSRILLFISPLTSDIIPLIHSMEVRTTAHSQPQVAQKTNTQKLLYPLLIFISTTKAIPDGKEKLLGYLFLTCWLNDIPPLQVPNRGIVQIRLQQRWRAQLMQTGSPIANRDGVM